MLTSEMTENQNAELLWLAGLLEGEGWFSVDAHGSRAHMGMTSTDVDVLERAARILDVRVRSRAVRRPNAKPQYQIAITGYRAVPWLVALRPLMGTRRQQQIEKCLAAQSSGVVPRRGAYQRRSTTLGSQECRKN